MKSIKLEENAKADGILYILGQRINAALIPVEVAVKNHLNDIRKHLNEPDELYRITQRMLEDNPSIVGSAIAFSPDYFPEKGVWFSPYSYREANGISSKQLGSADYDYHKMDWYKTTDSLKHEYWSNPYYDKGGGEMLMSTYSYPLTDEAGNLIAVVTADILLDDLSNLLEVDYYEHAYACMISRSGFFISHPQDELLIEESEAEEVSYPELEEIRQEMIDGKSGMREWYSPVLGDSYIFFVPFEHTGWSLAIVCKATELFSGIYKTMFSLGVLFVIMLIILTIILRRGIHTIIAPLTTFSEAADEVAHGNLQATLPKVRYRDEMHRLHHSFSTMQQSLVSQMEELKHVNEAKGRIEGELKVAKDIQLSMLPKAFTPTDDNKNLDIYGQQISAHEVGGDFYDFLLRDDKLFFCIGDVSGKGVPAALVMSRTLDQFRNEASHQDNLEEIVGFINKKLCSGNDTCIFITFFAGVLDLSSGLLHYCNGGHNKPFLISESIQANTSELGIAELPAKPNLPLGISDDAAYVVREYAVPPGTIIFLYTDGLTEAMNAQNERFGLERLTEQLKNQTQPANAKSLIEEMSQTVNQFVGKAPQCDDLTMLAIHFLETHEKQNSTTT